MALKDYTVGQFMLGGVQVQGLKWGLEFEMEGKLQTQEALPAGWRAVGDGSIPAGLEFVSKKPVTQVRNHVLQLSQYLRETGARVDESVRASTHVHMNVQDLTLKQLAQLVILFAVCEPAIMPMCGEHRSGNFFAVPLAVSDEPLMSLAACFAQGNIRDFLREANNRYASLNVHSLTKFGTLEFRAFRGVQDPEEIMPWIDMLTRIRVEALRYENPQHLVESMSAEGLDTFVTRVTGVLDVPEEDIWEVMRSAQFLAYRPDWNGVPPKKSVDTLKDYIDEALPDNPGEWRPLNGPGLRPIRMPAAFHIRDQIEPLQAPIVIEEDL